MEPTPTTSSKKKMVVLVLVGLVIVAALAYIFLKKTEPVLNLDKEIPALNDDSRKDQVPPIDGTPKDSVPPVDAQ